MFHIYFFFVCGSVHTDLAHVPRLRSRAARRDYDDPQTESFSARQLRIFRHAAKRTHMRVKKCVAFSPQCRVSNQGRGSEGQLGGSCIVFLKKATGQEMNAPALIRQRPFSGDPASFTCRLCRPSSIWRPFMWAYLQVRASTDLNLLLQHTPHQTVLTLKSPCSGTVAFLRLLRLIGLLGKYIWIFIGLSPFFLDL